MSCSIALWKWTEAPGGTPHPKYNHRYVSHGVKDAMESVPINHEHVTTRKSMVDRILGSMPDDDLEDFLDESGVACIVTKEEHGRLSRSPRSGWMRYLDAGVRVFDREQSGFVDVADLVDGRSPSIERANDAPDAPSAVPAEPLVPELIAEFARNPALLQELCRVGRLMSAVTVPMRTTRSRPDYFRMHDAVVEEPTRAAAYIHFNGNVHLGLTIPEVPENLAPAVTEAPEGNATYRVRCTVTDDATLQAAEELLMLALDKIRHGAEATEPSGADGDA